MQRVKYRVFIWLVTKNSEQGKNYRVDLSLNPQTFPSVFGGRQYETKSAITRSKF